MASHIVRAGYGVPKTAVMCCIGIRLCEVYHRLGRQVNCKTTIAAIFCNFFTLLYLRFVLAPAAKAYSGKHRGGIC